MAVVARIIGYSLLTAGLGAVLGFASFRSPNTVGTVLASCSPVSEQSSEPSQGPLERS